MTEDQRIQGATHDADGLAAIARVAAIARYDILDTAREEVFDDIAAMAADIFDAPMAVVNFITDDRQWFKAEVGIGDGQLPLEVSICKHAIQQPGIMVVPDLTRDARFDANPMVRTADGLKFYAGAVLETPDGSAIGTVCVLDTAARPEGISPRQERALRALASHTMVQLELRRTVALAEYEAAKAEKRGHRLALLAEGAALMLDAEDPATLIRRVYALLQGPLALETFFFYTCGASDLRLIAAAGLSPELEREARRLEYGQTICGMVA